MFKQVMGGLQCGSDKEMRWHVHHTFLEHCSAPAPDRRQAANRSRNSTSSSSQAAETSSSGKAASAAQRAATSNRALIAIFHKHLIDASIQHEL